jgi:hypothetical protein
LGLQLNQCTLLPVVRLVFVHAIIDHLFNNQLERHFVFLVVIERASAILSEGKVDEVLVNLGLELIEDVLDTTVGGHYDFVVQSLFLGFEFGV